MDLEKKASHEAAKPPCVFHSLRVCTPLCGPTNTKTGRADASSSTDHAILSSLCRSQAPDTANDRPHQNPISLAGGAHRDPKRLALSKKRREARNKTQSALK